MFNCLKQWIQKTVLGMVIANKKKLTRRVKILMTQSMLLVRALKHADTDPEIIFQPFFSSTASPYSTESLPHR